VKEGGEENRIRVLFQAKEREQRPAMEDRKKVIAEKKEARR